MRENNNSSAVHCQYYRMTYRSKKKRGPAKKEVHGPNKGDNKRKQLQRSEIASIKQG